MLGPLSCSRSFIFKPKFWIGHAVRTATFDLHVEHLFRGLLSRTNGNVARPEFPNGVHWGAARYLSSIVGFGRAYVGSERPAAIIK